mgnify:CR=1 FL=1
MKRGYFVSGDEECGLAVVASSGREAKTIAWNSVLHSDYDWIDIRIRWVRDADVSDLPIGSMQDARDALIRGLYGSLAEYPCDECGQDAYVVCWSGRALCGCCIERAQALFISLYMQ